MRSNIKLHVLVLLNKMELLSVKIDIFLKSTGFFSHLFNGALIVVFLKNLIPSRVHIVALSQWKFLLGSLDVFFPLLFLNNGDKLDAKATNIYMLDIPVLKRGIGVIALEK